MKPGLAQGTSTALTPITTTALDTGPNSELVSSVPVYKTWEPSVEKVVYSLAIPSVKAGEALRTTGDVELSGSHSYPISASERLVLGSNPSNAEGTVVTPRANTTFASQISHLSLPIDGLYNATSDLGAQYLKLVVKAPAFEAKEGDVLNVVSNSGGLSVTRYAPTAGPTSLPTHELRAFTSASEQITAIPVDSNWHSVLSVDVGDVSTEDLLELSGQLEIGNTNAGSVTLESRVLAATTPTGTEPGSNGLTISEDTSDMLTSSNRFARIVQSNEASTDSSSKHYVNLLVRAVPPGEGAFTPLTVEAGSAVLNVMRFKPNPGNPAEAMRPGTLERTNWDSVIDTTSVPFAVEDSGPVVVNSAPIDELRKGDVIRARSSLTADLGDGESAPVETELIMADSPTATTGETVARRSGDTIPFGQQVHTILKSGTFVAPKASFWVRKYINLVVYANRKPTKEGEKLTVSRASVSYSRAEPTSPFSAGFEDGSLDQFFRFGEKTTAVTANQAREGTKALQVDVDSKSWCNECDAGQDETKSIRRAMIGPSDSYSSGGFAGEDRWYGWSVYFPESFKVPSVESSYFTGKIDEVRLYNQTLGQPQIETDKNGEYGKTGASPVAAYSFEESQKEVEEKGIAHDSTAGHHDGMIEGADWAASGKYGSALDFNGVKDLVRIPDASELDLTKSFTLEAWVDPKTLRWWDPIISKAEGPQDHSSNTSGYVLNAGTHALPGGAVFSSGTTKEVFDESGELPKNTWSHLALTSDGNNLRIYVNGVLKATKLAIEAAPTAADLLLGTNSFNPETSGTWNLFTQWHHGTDGINCETNTSVPIGFSATYWKAHGHENPSEGETPVDGDYIEASFNGGQLDSECHSLKPTQHYIIAPLHRGYWYDFVMHTRWTTEEGGPGNSITAVWLNGKQVLGNETTPVWKPTLYWKSSPEVHNSITGWSSGLYRGPSAEDPTTRLFFDSMRTGESYAEVAPEVHAPRVDAESYPATLNGPGLSELATNLGTFKCAGATLGGAATSATSQFSLQPGYGECEITSGGTKYVASVKMNGCHYVLGVKNAGPPYKGTWGLACEKEGEALEFKLTKSAANCLKLFPQSGLEGIALTNAGEGSKRGIGITAEVKGAKYEWVGVCGKGEVRTDGIFKGEASLVASNAKAEQIGASLTGDEVSP